MYLPPPVYAVQRRDQSFDDSSYTYFYIYLYIFIPPLCIHVNVINRCLFVCVCVSISVCMNVCIYICPSTRFHFSVYRSVYMVEQVCKCACLYA